MSRDNGKDERSHAGSAAAGASASPRSGEEVKTAKRRHGSRWSRVPASGRRWQRLSLFSTPTTQFEFVSDSNNTFWYGHRGTCQNLKFKSYCRPRRPQQIALPTVATALRTCPLPSRCHALLCHPPPRRRCVSRPCRAGTGAILTFLAHLRCLLIPLCVCACASPRSGPLNCRQSTTRR